MPIFSIVRGRNAVLLLTLLVAVVVAVPRQVSAAANPIEAGRTSITDQWTTVAISGDFVDPIVVAGPATEDNLEPGNVEIADVTPTGFRIRLREWDYLDGVHGPETASYLVAERGVSTLPSGAVYEAGTASLGSSWVRTHFEADFATAPRLLVTVMDNNGGPIAPRVKELNSNRVDLAQWTEEAAGSEPASPASYVAWSNGSGSAATDGLTWESGIFRTDEVEREFNFSQNYRTACVLATISSPTSNPVTAVLPTLTNTGIGLRAAEEQSANLEVGLGSEVFSYLVVDCDDADPAPDVEPPVWLVSQMAILDVSHRSVTLDWAPGAIDNVGIAEYRVRSEGVPIASTTNLSATIDGLDSETSYSFGIEAIDTAGNITSLPQTVSATTTETPPTPPSPLDTGSVLVSSDWAQVSLSRSFIDPVVVVGPATDMDPEPGLVEVRNVTPTSFQLRFAEWEYLDGVHEEEIVSYLVVERGTTTLPSGARIEAGTATSSTSTTRNQLFSEAFAGRPSIAVTIVDRSSEPLTAPRVVSLTNTRIRHRLWVEEAEPARPEQQLNWVAWSTGSDDGLVDGFAWETSSIVTDERARAIPLTRDYSTACIFGNVRTNTPNPATVRRTGENQLELRIVEEQSRDLELGLGNETITYIALDCENRSIADDFEPPTWNTSTASVTAVTDTAVRLEWAPGAADTQGVQYEVSLDGSPVGETSATSLLVRDLLPDTEYQFAIEAFDLAGNRTSNGPRVTSTTKQSPAATAGTPFGTFLSLDNIDERLPQSGAARFLFGSPAEATAYLEQARAVEAKLVFALVQSQNMHNPDGTLDLNQWKREVDRFADFDFAPYVDDGTIIGHYIIDEPKAPGSWGGEVVTNTIIDEMAGYSKAYWPSVPTIIRNSPERLIDHADGFNMPRAEPYSWQHLDVAWVQYSQANHGILSNYAAEQLAAAAQQDLGLIYGLQLLAGGNGSSGLHPGAPLNTARWLMSYNEVMNYGTYLLDQQASCAFITFRWDRNEETYFAEGTDLRRAHDDLQAVAANRQPATCGLRR